MSKASNSFRIFEISWEAGYIELSLIRREVFIVEQQVPVTLEWDGLDFEAIHILAVDQEEKAVGCARILEGGSIGRMAVLKNWRGKGIGMRLLQCAISICRMRGWKEISLCAQIHAIPFYERAGFQVCSVEYMDASIPHKDMKLHLSS